MRLFFLLLIFLALPLPLTASTADGICYEQKEISAELLSDYLAGQGQMAINCDTLLSTNEHYDLSVEILSTHKNLIEESSASMSQFCERNGINKNEYLLSRMKNIMTMISLIKVTEEECRTFRADLEKRLDPAYLLKQILRAAIIGHHQYPLCDD